MNTLKNKLKGIDLFSAKVHLNFRQKDNGHSSLLGGLASIVVYLFIFFILISNVIEMVK